MRLMEWREMETIRGNRSQYRPRTAALLRKYFKLSIEIGRLPSLIGREFFRAKVTGYATSTFEDTVIFVHDMERSLELLDPHSQAVVARTFFQEYTYDEAARLLRVSRSTFARDVAGALDSLSHILLERGLMCSTQEPMSLSQVKDGKRLEPPPEEERVGSRFLLRLRYPKLCQAPSIRKIRLNQ